MQLVICIVRMRFLFSFFDILATVVSIIIIMIIKQTLAPKKASKIQYSSGSVWVYGTWSTLKSDTYIPCAPDNATDGCTPGSCHEVLLTFAFVTCTTEWVLIGAAIVGISWKVYHICFKKEVMI